MEKENEQFVPIQIGNIRGFQKKNFNLALLWDKIKNELDADRPYYARKHWRKVFYIPIDDSLNIYVKKIDDRYHDRSSYIKNIFSNEASRYFHNYSTIKKLNITTPDVLFVLGKKRGLFWVRSILGTAELVGYSTWNEFFTNKISGDNFHFMKEKVFHQIAQIAALLHKRGYYFSLDTDNILLANINGQIDVALIDLDHIKHYGNKIPKKVRDRNFRRFQKKISKTSGIKNSDFVAFLNQYEKFMDNGAMSYGQSDKK